MANRYYGAGPQDCWSALPPHHGQMADYAQGSVFESFS